MIDAKYEQCVESLFTELGVGDGAFVLEADMVRNSSTLDVRNLEEDLIARTALTKKVKTKAAAMTLITVLIVGASGMGGLTSLGLSGAASIMTGKLNLAPTVVIGALGVAASIISAVTTKKAYSDNTKTRAEMHDWLDKKILEVDNALKHGKGDTASLKLIKTKLERLKKSMEIEDVTPPPAVVHHYC